LVRIPVRPRDLSLFRSV